VAAFAARRDHPRCLRVLPDGAVLVVETDALSKPGCVQRLRRPCVRSIPALRKPAGACSEYCRPSMCADAQTAGSARAKTKTCR